MSLNQYFSQPSFFKQQTKKSRGKKILPRQGCVYRCVIGLYIAVDVYVDQKKPICLKYLKIDPFAGEIRFIA